MLNKEPIYPPYLLSNFYTIFFIFGSFNIYKASIGLDYTSLSFYIHSGSFNSS